MSEIGYRRNKWNYMILTLFNHITQLYKYVDMIEKLK